MFTLFCHILTAVAMVAFVIRRNFINFMLGGCICEVGSGGGVNIGWVVSILPLLQRLLPPPPPPQRHHHAIDSGNILAENQDFSVSE